MVWLFVLILALNSCNSQKEIYFFTSFREPADRGLRLLYSFDGYHWTDMDTVFLTPQVGRQKVMRDPSIVRGPDGTFHLVWTSSWKGDFGFGYAYSKDLIHWSEQKSIQVMAFDTATVNVWAPELFYEPETQEFIILWASTIPFRFAKGVEEEHNNHRIYSTTTKDFKTFTPAKLFFDPGYSVIDAVMVKRAKQDYVLIFKDNTRPNRNLRAAFSAGPCGPWSGITQAFTGFLTEGPTVIKSGDAWLIFYDAYGDHNYRAAITGDFIHYQDATGTIDIPAGHKHGTIFTANRKILIQLQKFCRK